MTSSVYLSKTLARDFTKNMLLPPPAQSDFEKELKNTIPEREQGTFARYLKKGGTYVSQMLSPDHPRQSIPFRFIEWLWACDALSREVGDKTLSLVLRERGNWLTSDLRPMLALDSKHLTKSIGTEYCEALDKELNGATVDEQIKEYSDVIEAAELKIDALRRQKALEFLVGK